MFIFKYITIAWNNANNSTAKSKKGFKPKAAPRRIPLATSALEAAKQLTPASETPRGSTPVSESAALVAPATNDEIEITPLQIAGTTSVEATRPVEVAQDSAHNQEQAPIAQKNGSSTEQDNLASITTRTTRNGIRAASVQRAITPPATQATTQDIPGPAPLSIPESTQAPLTVPPSPPPTQPPAAKNVIGSHLQKSKKVIKPRATTRNTRLAAPDPGIVIRENTPEIVEETSITNDATTIDVDPITEPVENRLREALAVDGNINENQATYAQPEASERPAQTTTANTRRSRRRATTPPIDDASAQLNAESEAAGAASRSQVQPQVSKRGKKRKQHAGAAEKIPSPVDDLADVAPPKKKRARVRKAAPAQVLDPETEDLFVAQPGDEAIAQPKTRPRKRKRVAAEEAANLEIAPDEMTMDILTKDTGQGKISAREKRLQERDERVKKHKLEMNQAEARGELEQFMEDPANALVETNTTRRTLADIEAAQASRSISPDAPAAAPQFRIVNGQIVQDESSRVIDRRAERQRAIEASDDNAGIIEEDDLSRRINSRSFAKRDRPNRWDHDATALFHKGLQYFGLEFSMMGCLFPGRSRRQLKAKFIREERADVEFVNKLLSARLPVPSREELEEIMGKKLKDPKEMEEELRLQKEELEEAQRAETALIEERRLEREKEAEMEAQRADGGDDDDGHGSDNSKDEVDENEAGDGIAADDEQEEPDGGEDEGEEEEVANPEDSIMYG